MHGHREGRSAALDKGNKLRRVTQKNADVVADLDCMTCRQYRLPHPVCGGGGAGTWNSSLLASTGCSALLLYLSDPQGEVGARLV